MDAVSREAEAGVGRLSAASSDKIGSAMADPMHSNPSTGSLPLEYQARRLKVRRALPHTALDGWSTDAAALLVLVCSSLCLGALSWWLAVWG